MAFLSVSPFSHSYCRGQNISLIQFHQKQVMPLVMVVGTHQDGGDHGAGHHQHDRVEVRRCKVESGELRTWRGRRYNLKLPAIQTLNICWWRWFSGTLNSAVKWMWRKQESVDQIENWEEKGPNLEMLQVTRSLFYLTLFPAEFSVSPFKSAGEVVIVIINQPTSQQSSKELGS